jgi:CMP-N,N'-diacetyllegionaminic acid synthase
MKILGYIPARSGSKGVVNKNIKQLNHKPLLQYTLRTAMDCLEMGVLDDVLVSTDSKDYLKLCEQEGFETRYLRPKELASDTSPTIDGIIHALDWYECQSNKAFDAVMIMQPTSPFRRIEDVISSIKLLKGNPNASCVASVMKLEDHHPRRIKKIQDNVLIDFTPDLIEPEPSRRQDFEPIAYIRNGAIYLTRTNVIKQEGKIRGDTVIPYIMPASNSVNIDTHFDFVTAEAALNYLPYEENLCVFRNVK